MQSNTPDAMRPLGPLERTCLLLAPLVVFGLGMWGLWPWFDLAHRRVEPWRISLFWVSELISLFWYLYYLPGIIANRFRVLPISYLVWGIFFVGFGVDLAFTLSAIEAEQQAYARSVPAREAHALKATFRMSNRGIKRVRTLECKFLDQRGVQHRVTFADFLNPFPDRVERLAIGGRMPFPLGIRYDPELPRRSWLTAADKPYATFQGLGLIALLMSTLFGAIFLLLQRDNKVKVPVEIAPFLGNSVAYAMIGIPNLFSLI